jgi:hypothetical protein
MHVRFVVVIAALLAALPAWGQAPADNQVDLLLALGADVSRSVDDQEFRLQRNGYAAGLAHPRVQEAIQSGGLGRIAVLYYEWSGTAAQRVIVDWTVIANVADAERFGDQLREAPRAFMDRTAIGAAIEYGIAQMARSPFQAQRRVLDISGDGTNTNGTAPGLARDAAVELGVTINGLVILSPVPLPWNPAHTHPVGGLENYFKDHVIGGPGSFTMVAEGFETFNKAILAKLIREIALAPPPDQRSVPSRLN